MQFFISRYQKTYMSSKPKQKHDFVALLLLFLVIWSAGGANEYQQLLYSTNGNIIFSAVIILVCVYLLKNQNKPLLPNKLFFLLAFLFVWGSLGTLISSLPKNYFYIIYNSFIAYTLIVLLKEKVFFYYEKYVTILSLISLVVYFVVIIDPNIGAIMKSISIIKGGPTMESNFLFVGIAPIDPTNAIIFPRRNVGFAWEAGRFAAIVVVAIYINLIINHFKIKGNKNLLILFITLITTQSTTGYFSLLIPILTYLNNVKKKYLVIPISIVLTFCYISLSFMSDKIDKTINWQENQSVSFDDQMNYYSRIGSAYVPQRAEGLYYDFLNFIHDPIFGYGPKYENSYD